MRLTTLTMFLFLGACTISSTGGEPASVECTTGADGEMICTQNGEDEDRPGDNEGDQPPDGTTSCSSEECVVTCDEGGTNEDGSESNVRHCVIECANGLRCDQVCNGETCSLSCTCPDPGDPTDPGCTAENPENCDPGCPDGTENCDPTDPCQDRPGTEDCPQPDPCEENPDSTDCQPTDPPDCDNSEDPACCNHDTDAEHEAYCQEHPESPEC